jgi:hypothetical protein
MVFFSSSLALQARPLLAANAAFVVLFTVFIVALLSLIVIVLVWAIRRDRQGRIAWRERQQRSASAPAADGDAEPPHP